MLFRSSLQIDQDLSAKEKDNFFITKGAYYSAEINIHCLTSIIILVSKGYLPSYALNTYLFSSQPCEATFRTARALTGTLSTITNFSVCQFMNKIEKISILNHIKSTEESSNTPCSLKFPIHHKHQRNEPVRSMNNNNTSRITLDDIEKTITKAYHQAELIMNDFSLSEKLKKENLNDMKKLSSFVFRRLTKHSTVDYSTINNNNDDDTKKNNTIS